jgi:hypothetical protein
MGAKPSEPLARKGFALELILRDRIRSDEIREPALPLMLGKRSHAERGASKSSRPQKLCDPQPSALYPIMCWLIYMQRLQLFVSAGAPQAAREPDCEYRL